MASDAAWLSALNIWILRFKEAQKVIRELEAEIAEKDEEILRLRSSSTGDKASAGGHS